MYHVSFHVVVEKHSLLVGIQQQAVAAVRVDVVDVGMQQQRMAPKGLGVSLNLCVCVSNNVIWRFPASHRIPLVCMKKWVGKMPCIGMESSSASVEEL